MCQIQQQTRQRRKTTPPSRLPFRSLNFLQFYSRELMQTLCGLWSFWRSHTLLNTLRVQNWFEVWRSSGGRPSPRLFSPFECFCWKRVVITMYFNSLNQWTWHASKRLIGGYSRLQSGFLDRQDASFGNSRSFIQLHLSCEFIEMALKPYRAFVFEKTSLQSRQ